MAVIDVSKWYKKNIWRTSNGELIVRPGFRRIYAPPTGCTIVAAFSIRNDFVDEVWHYIVTKHASDGIHVLIVDENFDVFQDFKWATDGEPRCVTSAVVEGAMMITSPDLPSLFGMVGSGLGYAVAVASVSEFTTIAPPVGICTSFCNRVAVAQGRSIFFSDAVSNEIGDIRTFVGFNQNQRPGIVYGLHEGAGGMLVAVTSEGTYGLDADAAAVQIVGSNGTAWRLLSHISVHSYLSSCVHRGRVYALTRDGWAPADTESTDEMFLADPILPRARGPRVFADDFRRCRMFALDEGPAVCSVQLEAIHRSDQSHEVSSWWFDQTDNRGDLRGSLRDHDGTELLAMSAGIYRIMGDFDGLIAIAAAEDASDEVVGTFFSTVDGAANENRLPRKINFAAAVDGAHRILVAVRGSEHSATVDPDPMGLTIGVDNFGDDLFYTSTPIADAEIDFGDIADTPATRDVGIELSAEGCLTRVNLLPDIEQSKSAKTRAQAKG